MKITCEHCLYLNSPSTDADITGVESLSHFSELYSGNLKIQSNSDGSAQINFGGGGRHLVKSGIKSSVAALMEAYGSRLQNSSMQLSQITHEEEAISAANSGSTKMVSGNVLVEPLTINKAADGSAFILFSGGGKHTVLPSGPVDPVTALKQAYGSRISAVVESYSSTQALLEVD